MGLSLAALFSWSYLVPIHLKNLGASAENVAVAYTLIALSIALFQLLGGILADRFGRKVLVYAPTFALVPPLILLVFVTDWVQAAALVVLINMISGLQFPAFSAILAESTEERHRAFIWFEAALSFGAAVGPIIGAILLRSYDLTILFAGSAVICALAGLLALFKLKETKHAAAHAHQPLRWREVFDVNLRWYFLSGVFVALVFSISILGPFPTLHLDEALKLSESDINLLFAAGWGIAAILSVFGERLAKKFGPKNILMWSALLHPATLLLWYMAGASGVHVAVFLISLFFAQFILVGHHLMVAELTTQESRGRIAGMIGTSTGILRSIGPILAMQAKLSWGDWLPFGLAALWGILAFLALIPCHTPRNLMK